MSKLPDMRNVKSTNVEAIGWHGGDLFVRFKGGKTYHYADVPQSLYHSGIVAESPGKWFREHVRGNFESKQHDAQSHDR